MDPLRRMKASLFDELTLNDGAIVFLGDSITEGGAWHEWFPDLPVINRGIGGDTTDGVLARLDSAIASPSQVFLLIGTNDLALRRPMDNVLANQRAIVAAIAASGAQLFIQSVLPRKNVKKYGQRINQLNQNAEALANEYGATYLDLTPIFSDAAGELRQDFTRDGLHLNGAGYRAWVEVLRPLLRTRENVPD